MVWVIMDIIIRSGPIFQNTTIRFTEFKPINIQTSPIIFLEILLWKLTLANGLKIKTLGGVNISMYSGSYFQPEDDRQVQQYGAAAGASQNALYSQHLYKALTGFGKIPFRTTEHLVNMRSILWAVFLHRKPPTILWEVVAFHPIL